MDSADWKTILAQGLFALMLAGAYWIREVATARQRKREREEDRERDER